ncbi:hypothetical protein BHE74_00058526, partial [Ensete ventricosum]
MATAFGRKTGRMGDGDTVEGWKAIILDGVEEEEAAAASKAAAMATAVYVGHRGRWDGKQRESSGEARMVGDGGREERNRGGRGKKRHRRACCSEEGLGYDRSGWEGSGEGCGSGRAARSGEEAKEEAEEGAAGAATEEGYGRLEAAV